MKKEEFINLIDSNRNLIYKICHSYCPDPGKRQDLEQEILIQLWNSYPKFDGRVKISTWFYKVALNTAISFYRTDYRINKNLIYLDKTVISEVAENNTPKDDQYELLYTFISRLTEFDKALILLYLDDLSYNDIAEIMGISESNVGTKLNRIRHKLKTQLKNL
ncbi:RNA polymerase sigma factor [Saccharicrinis sp. FJH54]|uniref:RNA polymerase sigma factor n=1 Tax=Saccharicrinis sp. FJH54 TaxID=3344665 RepID=UPI0035D4FC6E